MANETEVRVPDIGDFKDVDVIEVLVSEGDHVDAEDPLITLESDKATMDVPSPVAGTVRSLAIKVGDKASEGTPILSLEADDTGKPTETEVQAAGGDAAAEAGDAERSEAEVSPSGGDTVEVKVPDIGDFKDVDVIEVHVSAGDEVEAEDPLITLESDKATMDVPAPRAGRFAELSVKVGDKVSEGSVIGTLETSGEAAQPAAQKKAPNKGEAKAAKAEPAPAPAQREAPAQADEDPRRPRGQPSPPPSLPSAPPDAGQLPHASPSVRRFARELGVDPRRVSGSGPKGRILHGDVSAFVKAELARPAAAPGTSAAGLPEMPEIDFSKFGETETQPLSRIKRRSGPNVHRSWLVVPHVTQHDEADITELEDFRNLHKDEAKKQGFGLTLLGFLMKASVAALKRYPEFNSSLDRDGENLIVKKYYHIGIAVDTPEGLVVPVVRDVDSKGLFALGKELAEVSAKARDKKLTPTDLQGASFTISSLGGIGGTAFTPIVNAPEVAILGVSRSRLQPVYVDGKFVPRLMLPLSLSYDHRVIDGASAARFTGYLGQVLGDIRQLLL